MDPHRKHRTTRREQMTMSEIHVPIVKRSVLMLSHDTAAIEQMESPFTTPIYSLQRAADPPGHCSWMQHLEKAIGVAATVGSSGSVSSHQPDSALIVPPPGQSPPSVQMEQTRPAPPAPLLTYPGWQEQAVALIAATVGVVE